VKTPDDLLKILKVGQKQRKVGATKMNEGSSRSHSILTITIESSEKSKDKDGNETVHYKVGKLNMVDLAGSERQKKCWGAGTLMRMFDGSVKQVEKIQVSGNIASGAQFRLLGS
jgi:kinesin family protein 3/17